MKRLAFILRGHGLSVWWDYGLEAGESFRVQISEELARAGIVSPLWCSESIESKWVCLEAELGKDRLVPARLQNVVPPKDFSDLQAADLVGWDGSVDDPRLTAFIRKICERLKKSPYAPVDTIEALRDMKTISPLPAIANNPSKESDVRPEVLLADLRATWAQFQTTEDRGMVERFFEHVSRSAPGTGLEFEVRQHLDKSLIQDAQPASPPVSSTAPAVPAANALKKVGVKKMFWLPNPTRKERRA